MIENTREKIGIRESSIHQFSFKGWPGLRLDFIILAKAHRWKSISYYIRNKVTNAIKVSDNDTSHFTGTTRKEQLKR